MTVYDLNRDQLEELKQRYLFEALDERGETPSWGELADVDNVYSDDFIRKVYADYEFSSDDFFCSAGEEEMELFISNCFGTREDIAEDLEYIAKAIRAGSLFGNAPHGTKWDY